MVSKGPWTSFTQYMTPGTGLTAHLQGHGLYICKLIIHDLARDRGVSKRQCVHYSLLGCHSRSAGITLGCIEVSNWLFHGYAAEGFTPRTPSLCTCGTASRGLAHHAAAAAPGPPHYELHPHLQPGLHSLPQHCCNHNIRERRLALPHHCYRTLSTVTGPQTRLGPPEMLTRGRQGEGLRDWRHQIHKRACSIVASSMTASAPPSKPSSFCLTRSSTLSASALVMLSSLLPAASSRPVASNNCHDLLRPDKALGPCDNRHTSTCV